ncbi:MAG: hypothetical protein AAF543_13830 [Pseudomonadota bacterium]
MRRFMLLAPAVAFGLLLSSPASANEARCTFLGPLAVSAYADVLGALGQPDPTLRAQRIRQAEQAVGLYHQLDCPDDALNGALDCLSQKVVDQAVGGDLPGALESCMKDAGMPTR